MINSLRQSYYRLGKVVRFLLTAQWSVMSLGMTISQNSIALTLFRNDMSQFIFLGYIFCLIYKTEWKILKVISTWRAYIHCEVSPGISTAWCIWYSFSKVLCWKGLINSQIMSKTRVIFEKKTKKNGSGS